MKFASFLLAFCLLCPLSTKATAESVRLGVADYVKAGLHTELVTSTFNLLKKVLEPGHKLEIIFLEEKELSKAVENHDVDLILSSSFFYRQMARQGARDLVSVETVKDDDPNQSAGAVLLVKGDRTEFLGISDLKDRRIGYGSNFGPLGFIALQGELTSRGLKANQFFKETVAFSTGIRDILGNLKNDAIDAVLLPACFLESIIEQEDLPTSWLRVLEPRHFSSLRCAHSTVLFPGLTLSSLPSLNPRLSRKITQSLLAMPPSDQGSYWSVATDFGQTDKTLRMLDLDAWAADRAWTLKNVITKYWHLLLAILLIILGLISYGYVVSALVGRRTEQLRSALIREKELKRQALETSQKLEQMQRTGAFNQLSSLFAHELGQPLYAIQCFCYSLFRRLQGEERDKKEVLGLVKDIENQAVRADEIVQKTRFFLKGKKAKPVPIELTDIVKRSITTFTTTLHKNCKFKLRALSREVYVLADGLDLELVIINLLRNSYEACAEQSGPKVTITISKPTAGEVVLSVADNGPEVPESFIKSLSKSKISQKENGLGFGLLIVSSLIENYGGRIVFRKSSSGGVQVDCILPIIEDKESYE